MGERKKRIEDKLRDIEAQIAYAEAAGWKDRAARQKQRRDLLRQAMRLKPETAWKKALELGKAFARGGGQRALEDALLYAYAATGRGLSDGEMLEAVAQEIAKEGQDG